MTKRVSISILLIFFYLILKGQAEIKNDTLILHKHLLNKQIDMEGKADSVFLHPILTPVWLEEDNIDLKLADLKFENNNQPKIKIPYVNLIAPSLLISYGIAAQYVKPLQKLDKEAQLSAIKRVTKRIPADDYIQFAPAVGVYAFDLIGIKAKHNLRDRTILMATSNLLMCATVQTLKHTTKVMRPSGSNRQSFPSGHTATAFVNAHILFKEYRDSNWWLAVSGYAVATATGVLRVMNNKHWVSDVVAGAGIGILSAEAAYLLLPHIKKMFGIEDVNKNLAIVPIIFQKQYSIGVSYTF
ncbi:phosphatase PAP2 family protein [Dysgonomonas mossii]|uniref:phosphatase PAP2 family protein n=1 Tax=Dysgonomonas mossii TaxID=163665 RepID=UPI003991E002